MTVKHWPATILTLIVAASALSACQGRMHDRGDMSSVRQVPSGVNPTVIQGRIGAAIATAARTKS